MIFRYAKAIHMLRKAAVQANQALLDKYAQQWLKAPTPEAKAKISNAIKSNSQILEMLRKWSLNKLKMWTYGNPAYSPEIGEDIVGSAILAFLRNNNIDQALNNYDPNFGGESTMSFSNWLFGRLWWNVKHYYNKWVQDSVTGKSGNSLMPSEHKPYYKDNGNSPPTIVPGVVSFDTPIRGNPKIPWENQIRPLPQVGKYNMPNAPKYDEGYGDLLEKVDTELKRLLSEPVTDPKVADQIARLREAHGELTQRLNAIEQDYEKWYGTKLPPADYATREKRIIPDFSTQITNFGDTDKINSRLQSHADFWDGLPEYIDRSYNIPKMFRDVNYDTNGRFYNPSEMYYKNISNSSAKSTKGSWTAHADPETRAKITQSLVAAFTEANLLTSKRGFKNMYVLDANDFGSRRISRSSIKEWFPNLVKKQMIARGIPEKDQESVQQFIAGKDLRSLQSGLDDAEEMQRLYSYNKLRNEMGAQDRALTPDEQQAILKNTWDVMGYDDEGASPNVRVHGPRGIYNQKGYKDWNKDQLRDYMAHEADWGSATRPDQPLMDLNSDFFMKKGPKNPTTPKDPFALMSANAKALTYRLAEQITYKGEINCLMRIAACFDNIYDIPNADAIERVILASSKFIS